MRKAPYDYSPIIERAPIVWPGGARVAFYVGLHIEHFMFGKSSTSVDPRTAALVPDPLNHGWRDYGPRVGIWRMAEVFDRCGVRPTALLNSDVVAEYPQIVEAGLARDWGWVAHGKTSSLLQAEVEIDERAYLTEVVETIARGTGRRPRGWLGPALSETFRTPKLLAELGLEYVLDWTGDDQPFRLSVPGMLGLPYALELNDLVLFTAHSVSGPEFVRIVRDQLDQLYADAEHSGRVMSLALHPFVTGQPFRTRYLAEALDYVVNHPGVWTTTSDEIATHYAATSTALAA